MNLDTFTRQYIETALWSSNDESTPEGGEPLDRNYDINDIAPDTLAKMIEDCAKFQADNANDIGDRYEDAGHDFWLTRNHHGANYSDGDWPEPAAVRLSTASHLFGECDLYVGDDGLIYGN